VRRTGYEGEALVSGIRRREFFILVGGSAAAAWPIAARAQRPAMPVVGFLRSAPSADSEYLVAAFRQGLREAGFVEGQDCGIEYRWADNQLDRLPALVADLLHRQVALIVGNTPSALAAKAATTTVPIVFASGDDPVRNGLVASLSRPGGNVTGISFLSAQLGAKQLGLLRELRPGAARLAVLVDPKFPTTERLLSEVRTAASLFTGSGGFLLSQRERIVALAARHKIPTIYVLREFVTAGGLMSYAPSITDAYRQAGIYAGRILKGEKPRDLPVMLPAKFEFVINLRTAKTLGLEVPDKLLALADEVIE
jgi:ABC-type uncharacterized transport system substrate-binding protein